MLYRYCYCANSVSDFHYTCNNTVEMWVVSKNAPNKRLPFETDFCTLKTHTFIMSEGRAIHYQLRYLVVKTVVTAITRCLGNKLLNVDVNKSASPCLSFCVIQNTIFQIYEMIFAIKCELYTHCFSQNPCHKNVFTS